jgi:N-acetylglucosamine-6-phosphate deacetylase
MKEMEKVKISFKNVRFLASNDNDKKEKLGFLMVSDGRIVDLDLGKPSDNQGCDFVIDGKGLWVSAGFVDLQINGLRGVDFNAAPFWEIVRAVKANFKYGVTYLSPTIITADSRAMRRAIRQIAAAKRLDPQVAKAILGIHVEGPFISSMDGPLGAHPREHVRLPNYEEYLKWQKISSGLVRIITLAPELPGAIEFIRKITLENVVAGLGHTDSKEEEVDKAISVGAKIGVHVWNADHPNIPKKDPGHIGEILARDELFASFIVDGIHIPKNMVAISLRAKGLDKSVLITDAMAAAGMPDGKYRLGGKEVEVNRGIAQDSSGRLAGSTLTMDKAIANVIRFTGITLEDAIRLATLNPATVLGLEKKIGSLEVGKQASLVLFDFDEKTYSLKIKLTMLEGEIVYKAS